MKKVRAAAVIAALLVAVGSIHIAAEGREEKVSTPETESQCSAIEVELKKPVMPVEKPVIVQTAGTVEDFVILPGEKVIAGSAPVIEETGVTEVTEVTEAVEEEPIRYEVPLSGEIQDAVIKGCDEYGIDPAVVFAIIQKESKYNADAVGDKGNSLGLMQIQPRWHKARMERLGVTDLMDPIGNVKVGIDYLAEMLGKYDGNMAAALTAYNKGHYKGVIAPYAESVLELSWKIEVAE